MTRFVIGVTLNNAWTLIILNIGKVLRFFSLFLTTQEILTHCFHSAILRGCSQAKPIGWSSVLPPWLVWFRLLSSPAVNLFSYCLWDYLLGLYLNLYLDKNSNKSLEQPHLILVSSVPEDFIPIWRRLSSWNICIRMHWRGKDRPAIVITSQ